MLRLEYIVSSACWSHNAQPGCASVCVHKQSIEQVCLQNAFTYIHQAMCMYTYLLKL